MGGLLSAPEDVRKLPNGKPAPQICGVCAKTSPCEHMSEILSASGIGSLTVALSKADADVADRPPRQAAVAAAAQTGAKLSRPVPKDHSALAPYEQEDISDARRKLQVPDLISNMVSFCDSLLQCYQLTDSADASFADEFVRLKYLTSRHKCIEDNKGKGVLVPDFVAAHLREVSDWLSQCEKFNQSFYLKTESRRAASSSVPSPPPLPSSVPPPPGE